MKHGQETRAGERTWSTGTHITKAEFQWPLCWKEHHGHRGEATTKCMRCHDDMATPVDLLSDVPIDMQLTKSAAG